MNFGSSNWISTISVNGKELKFDFGSWAESGLAAQPFAR
jgi:hypothetical protein